MQKAGYTAKAGLTAKAGFTAKHQVAACWTQCTNSIQAHGYARQSCQKVKLLVVAGEVALTNL